MSLFFSHTLRQPGEGGRRSTNIPVNLGIERMVVHDGEAEVRELVYDPSC